MLDFADAHYSYITSSGNHELKLVPGAYVSHSILHLTTVTQIMEKSVHDVQDFRESHPSVN